MASADRVLFSRSTLSLRLFPSQANVRSTVQRIGSLTQPRERVVVGQRQRLEPERVRVLDERGRRQQPVGGRRMAMQIEAQTLSSNALIVSDRSPRSSAT